MEWKLKARLFELCSYFTASDSSACKLQVVEGVRANVETQPYMTLLDCADSRGIEGALVAQRHDTRSECTGKLADFRPGATLKAFGLIVVAVE